MARTLTAATTTQKNATTTTPINIIEIDYGGVIGTKYYSDRALVSPVTAEARVLSWSSISLDSIEESGRIGDVSIPLLDNDRILLGYTRSQEIQHRTVYVWQWFSGLTWPADRVLLLKGTIKQYGWKENPPSLEISVENIESRFDGQIGTEATKVLFPSIRKEHEGRVLPLVYGRVERLEPVQIVDAKKTTLVLPLAANGSIAVVSDSRDFTQGIATIYNLLVGRELCKGWFDGSKLQLTQRGMVHTLGWTTGANPNLLSFKANLTPAGPTWIGLTVKMTIGGYPYTRVITGYTAPDVYHIDAWLPNIPAFTYYEIYKPAEKHDAGEEVHEKITNYTWIVNDAASTSVEKIEIETSIVLQGTGISNELKNIKNIADLPSTYYTVNLNDATWAGTIGHNVTSITMGFNPIDLPNTPYAGDWTVTLTGINYTNPVDIIVHLAQKLGMTYPGDFDTTSETAVKASTAWLLLGFAIQDKRGLEVLFDIAFQSRIALSWESGQMFFRYLQNSVGASAATITNTHREIDSIEIGKEDVSKIINKVVACFRERGIEREITSEDSGSITKFGEREKRLTLWAHNNRAYAAAIAAFWLRRWANAVETAVIRTFLTSLQVQRYDWITINDGTFYTTQLAEVRKIDQRPGQPGQIDQIEMQIRVPKFAGCASSCELYEQTGCASTCQQCCQSSAETACGYACETASQAPCTLTCVTACKIECTTQMEINRDCRLSCRTSCTAACQTGSTTGGPACQTTCTADCQTGTCETSCVVACEGGACQIYCETGAESECADVCQVDTQTSCYTTCEQGCQSGCTTQSCQTGGCEATSCQQACQATSCQACCENTCVLGCQNACQRGTCQNSCTNSYQGSCATACQSVCENNCQGQCEGRCQSCCQWDGSETTYQCTEYCQTAACMQNCQTAAQSSGGGGGIGACATACQAYCMTAAETGCGTYCTVGCECYCQANCQSNCMSETCQTACQCACQTATMSAACTGGTEGACYSVCQGYTETACNSGCQTGCQAYCQTAGCESSCQLYCTTGCQCDCQATCQDNCTTGCETSCECGCQTSVVYDTGAGGAACKTTCQITCTTMCRDFCQTQNQSTGCIAGGCQSFCMTAGCQSMCELNCRTGCQCDCQAACQSNCRTSLCETSCQCGCQTSVVWDRLACDGCQTGCMTSGQPGFGCKTACQSTCTTICRDYCMTACTTAACQTMCQTFCMTGGCQVGCEVYCTVGCQCACQATCQSNCRTGCEGSCMCLCQTAAQV